MTAMRCPHGLRFPPELLDQLRRIPNGVNMINAVGWCNLAAGHSCPHHSGEQMSMNDEYWVRWTDNSYELLVLPPCPAKRPMGNDEDPCLLFENHEGPHDFELEPYWSSVDDMYDSYSSWR